MIEIKPVPYHSFQCPKCQSNVVEVKETVLQGIHFLADCVCSKCNYSFYTDYPTGHALMYPSCIGKEDAVFYPNTKSKWLTKPLYTSFLNKFPNKISIEKKKFKEAKKVIILNCLDFLYGHSLLKLLNAEKYLEKHPEMGLIILIQKGFEWLLPAGIAEAWLVDIRLSETVNWFQELEDFYREEEKRFETIYLSLAYSHPDFAALDIEKFTGVKKFNLVDFQKQPFQLSFIIREDRLWFGSALEEFCFLACRKLKILKNIPPMLWFFLWLQKRRIVGFAKRNKKKYPGLRFNLIGIGQNLKFPTYIEDLRNTKIDTSVEKKWLEVYAQSHLVVGVHGSNMLLPTALAGGFIEILPNDRFGNMTQDIGSSLQGAKAWYLGRFLPDYSSAKTISKHSLAIFEHFNQFDKNTNPTYQPYQLIRDVKDIFGN